MASRRAQLSAEIVPSTLFIPFPHPLPLGIPALLFSCSVFTHTHMLARARTCTHTHARTRTHTGLGHVSQVGHSKQNAAFLLKASRMWQGAGCPPFGLSTEARSPPLPLPFLKAFKYTDSPRIMESTQSYADSLGKGTESSPTL